MSSPNAKPTVGAGDRHIIDELHTTASAFFDAATDAAEGAFNAHGDKVLQLIERHKKRLTELLGDDDHQQEIAEWINGFEQRSKEAHETKRGKTEEVTQAMVGVLKDATEQQAGEDVLPEYILPAEWTEDIIDTIGEVPSIQALVVERLRAYDEKEEMRKGTFSAHDRKHYMRAYVRLLVATALKLQEVPAGKLMGVLHEFAKEIHVFLYGKSYTSGVNMRNLEMIIAGKGKDLDSIAEVFGVVVRTSPAVFKKQERTEHLLDHVKALLGIGDADDTSTDADDASSAASATVDDSMEPVFTSPPIFVAEPPHLEMIPLQAPKKEVFTCLMPRVPELMALASLSAWQAMTAIQYILRANGGDTANMQQDIGEIIYKKSKASFDTQEIAALSRMMEYFVAKEFIERSGHPGLGAYGKELQQALVHELVLGLDEDELLMVPDVAGNVDQKHWNHYIYLLVGWTKRDKEKIFSKKALRDLMFEMAPQCGLSTDSAVQQLILDYLIAQKIILDKGAFLGMAPEIIDVCWTFIGRRTPESDDGGAAAEIEDEANADIDADPAGLTSPIQVDSVLAPIPMGGAELPDLPEEDEEIQESFDLDTFFTVDTSSVCEHPDKEKVKANFKHLMVALEDFPGENMGSMTTTAFFQMINAQGFGCNMYEAYLFFKVKVDAIDVDNMSDSDIHSIMALDALTFFLEYMFGWQAYETMRKNFSEYTTTSTLKPGFLAIWSEFAIAYGRDFNLTDFQSTEFEELCKERLPEQYGNDTRRKDGDFVGIVTCEVMFFEIMRKMTERKLASASPPPSPPPPPPPPFGGTPPPPHTPSHAPDGGPSVEAADIIERQRLVSTIQTVLLREMGPGGPLERLCKEDIAEAAGFEWTAEVRDALTVIFLWAITQGRNATFSLVTNNAAQYPITLAWQAIWDQCEALHIITLGGPDTGSLTPPQSSRNIGWDDQPSNPIYAAFPAPHELIVQYLDALGTRAEDNADVLACVNPLYLQPLTPKRLPGAPVPAAYDDLSKITGTLVPELVAELASRCPAYALPPITIAYLLHGLALCKDAAGMPERASARNLGWMIINHIDQWFQYVDISVVEAFMEVMMAKGLIQRVPTVAGTDPTYILIDNRQGLTDYALAAVPVTFPNVSETEDQSRSVMRAEVASTFPFFKKNPRLAEGMAIVIFQQVETGLDRTPSMAGRVAALARLSLTTQEVQQMYTLLEKLGLCTVTFDPATLAVTSLDFNFLSHRHALSIIRAGAPSYIDHIKERWGSSDIKKNITDAKDKAKRKWKELQDRKDEMLDDGREFEPGPLLVFTPADRWNAPNHPLNVVNDQDALLNRAASDAHQMLEEMLLVTGDADIDAHRADLENARDEIARVGIFDLYGLIVALQNLGRKFAPPSVIRLKNIFEKRLQQKIVERLDVEIVLPSGRRSTGAYWATGVRNNIRGHLRSGGYDADQIRMMLALMDKDIDEMKFSADIYTIITKATIQELHSDFADRQKCAEEGYKKIIYQRLMGLLEENGYVMFDIIGRSANPLEAAAEFLQQKRQRALDGTYEKEKKSHGNLVQRWWRRLVLDPLEEYYEENDGLAEDVYGRRMHALLGKGVQKVGKNRAAKEPRLRKEAEKKHYDKMYRKALNMDNLMYTPRLTHAQKADLGLESVELNVKHASIRGERRPGGAFAIAINQEEAQHPDKMIQEVLAYPGLTAKQKIYIIRQYIRIFIKNMYSGRDGNDGFGKLKGERAGKEYIILANGNNITLSFDEGATNFFDESIFIRDLCSSSRGRLLTTDEVKKHLTVVMNMFEQSQVAIENKAKSHFGKKYNENMVSLKNIDEAILNGVETFHEVKPVEISQGKTEEQLLIRDGKDLRTAVSLRFGLFYERPPLFLVRIDDKVYQIESLTPVSDADGIKGYKIVSSRPSICAYMAAQKEIKDAQFMAVYTRDIVRYYLAHPAFAERKANRNVYFTYGGVRYELSLSNAGELVVNMITTPAGTTDFIAKARQEFDAIETGAMTPEEKREELRKLYAKYRGLNIDRASLSTEQFMFYDRGVEEPIEWDIAENKKLRKPVGRWEIQSRRAYRLRGKVEDRTERVVNPPPPAALGVAPSRRAITEQPFRSDADFQEHLLKHLLDSIRKKPA